MSTTLERRRGKNALCAVPRAIFCAVLVACFVVSCLAGSCPANPDAASTSTASSSPSSLSSVTDPDLVGFIAAPQVLPAGSLLIPMDQNYQVYTGSNGYSRFNFNCYGHVEIGRAHV